jgi:transglutaminase-like putative cysteine protease
MQPRQTRARTIVTLIGLAVSACGAAHAAVSGESLYRFAPSPQWAKPLVPEYQAPLPAAGVSKGSWYLLIDSEINIRPDGSDFYQHTATRVVSATGVDEQSQIDITVDPTYQTLSLNSILVVREGKAIDESSRVRITALPQETQLRERIYNGNYNINVLLSDVRVGDVVEYAFTIRSAEHIFPGLTSDRLTVGWSDPVRRQQLRVLAPQNLPISYRNEDGSMPTARAVGDVRELTWQWHDLAAIAADDDRPSWYSPWPHVEISTAKDWSEVARRIAPLFEVRAAQTPALLAVVRKIREGGGTQAEQALRALQFVQEQIRYVSIDIGPGAFRPATPQQVLERRFGDCKDKALLLTTLLGNWASRRNRPWSTRGVGGRWTRRCRPRTYSIMQSCAPGSAVTFSGWTARLCSATRHCLPRHRRTSSVPWWWIRRAQAWNRSRDRRRMSGRNAAKC